MPKYFYGPYTKNDPVYIPPEHYRKPLIFGSICSTVTAIIILIWALAKGGGGGPLLKETEAFAGVTAAPTGGDLGFAFVFGVTSVLGKGLRIELLRGYVLILIRR